MKSKSTQFHIRPARPEEAGLFYAPNVTAGEPLAGRVTYVNDYPQEFTDADEFLACVQEELPYRSATGFRYEVLADDPTVRKAMDDMTYDFYGEENPRQLEEYQEQPEQGLTMGGMQL